MSKSSEYDFLNYNKDAKLLKIVNNETVLYSDKIDKINEKGWSQERNIVITNKAIYNIKGKSVKRTIPINILRGLTIHEKTDEFIIHCSGKEYDYYYKSQKKKTIAEIIANAFKEVSQQDLKIFPISNMENLKMFVTTETDKKQKNVDNNFTRMPVSKNVTISEYIYGGKKDDSKKVTASFNVPGLPKKSSIVAKTKLEDFTFLKVIGRGSIAKIIVAQHNKNKEFYAIKNIRKDQVISDDLYKSVEIEKNILSKNMDFLLNLSFFFQNDKRIYFVTPFIKGGDLYHRLKEEGHIPEEQAKFYLAQIVIAIDSLHQQKIAYRDLKPENILLEENGYIRLCDFSSCLEFQGTNKDNSFAGSPEYTAPEIITREGHNFMADWWSVGILLFEMLFGVPPFFANNQKRMFELITSSELKFPTMSKIIVIDEETMKPKEEYKKIKISDAAKKLISGLLDKDPGLRIGRLGLQEFRKQPFFSGINFDTLKAKKVKPPFKPTIDPDDLYSNFEEDFLNLETKDSPVGSWVDANRQKIFEDLEDK